MGPYAVASETTHLLSTSDARPLAGEYEAVPEADADVDVVTDGVVPMNGNTNGKANGHVKSNGKKRKHTNGANGHVNGCTHPVLNGASTDEEREQYMQPANGNGHGNGQIP